MRRELLDRMLILNQRQLATVLAQYVAHFNTTGLTEPWTRQRRCNRFHPRHRLPRFASDAAIGSVD